MRVGFISGRMSSLDGLHRYAHSGLARVIGALADRVEHLVVGTSESPTRPPEHDTVIRVPACRHVSLPWQPSAIAGLSQGAASRREIARIERRCDVVIFQLPFSPPWALSAPAQPRVYHVCADVPSVVRASKYYTGVRRVAAVGFAELAHAWTRAEVRQDGIRVVTNGQELFDRLARPKGRAVVSSSLRLDEVGSLVRSRSKDAPMRLLFCGYLRPEKGLDTLANAYLRILDSEPNAELVIVGRQDLSEGAADAELKQRLVGRGSVSFRGLLPFGDALFQEFADADVLVLPSRSEGTPRVLVEARAFGCPVVASRVGGIPTSVTDGVDGLLVPPDDPIALAHATLRAVRDRGLREKLVVNGMRRARESTVEALAEVLLDEARIAFEDHTRCSRAT